MMGHPHFHHMLASALNAVSSDARGKNSSGVHLPMLSGEDMFHTMDTDSIKTRVTFGASVGIQPETDAQGTIRNVESVMNPESMLKQLATDGILVRGVLVNDVNVQKAKPTPYSDGKPGDTTSQSEATYVTEIILVCCCAVIFTLTLCYIARHRPREDLSPNVFDKKEADTSDADSSGAYDFEPSATLSLGKRPAEPSSSTPVLGADEVNSCSNFSEVDVDADCRPRQFISDVAIEDIHLASLKLASGLDLTHSMLDGLRRPPPPVPLLPTPPTPAISPTSSPDTGVAPQAEVLDAGVLLAGTESSRTATLKARPVPPPSSVARSQRWPVRGTEPAATPGPMCDRDGGNQSEDSLVLSTPESSRAGSPVDSTVGGSSHSSSHDKSTLGAGTPLVTGQICMPLPTRAALTPQTHSATPVVDSGPSHRRGRNRKGRGLAFRALGLSSKTPLSAIYGHPASQRAKISAVDRRNVDGQHTEETEASEAARMASVALETEQRRAEAVALAELAAARERRRRLAGTPVGRAPGNTPAATRAGAAASSQGERALDQVTGTAEEAAPPPSLRPSPSPSPTPPQPAEFEQTPVLPHRDGRSRARNRRSGLGLAALAVASTPMQPMRSPTTRQDEADVASANVGDRAAALNDLV
jgi:hypothetical protein